MPQEFIYSVWEVNDLPEHVVQHAAGLIVPWQSFGDSVFRCRCVVSSQKPIKVPNWAGER